MLKPKSPQASFYGSYLYDRIVPQNHLLRKINAVVDFSFVHELLQDRYTPNFGRPAEDPEFMLRLCLLQYLYGDSDRQVIENARVNLAYKYFLGLAVDAEVPDDTTISYFRAKRLGEDKFRKIFQHIVRQCIDKGLVTGKHQIIDSTHITADMAITSLTGLLKLCRRNVLKTVESQDSKLAEKLGIDDLQIVKQDRFTRMEEGLESEIVKAKKLMDDVTTELRDKKLKITPELQKDLELLEKAVADREEGAKDRLISPIDPDARSGKKEQKRWMGYKGHLVVEQDSEIITAVETTPANTADGSQLKPLLHKRSKPMLSSQKYSVVIKPMVPEYIQEQHLEFLRSQTPESFVALAEELGFSYLFAKEPVTELSEPVVSMAESVQIPAKKKVYLPQFNLYLTE